MEECVEISIEGRSFKVYSNSQVQSIDGHCYKPQDNGNGYKYVRIGRWKSIKKNYYVHILVATYFIPNPLNLPEVNHKDADRGNNHYKNLEWIDRLGNILEYRKRGRGYSPPRKKVIQYSKEGVFIKTWDSAITAAKELGCTKELISMAANPNYKQCVTAFGYKWRYNESDELRKVNPYLL